MLCFSVISAMVVYLRSWILAKITWIGGLGGGKEGFSSLCANSIDRFVESLQQVLNDVWNEKFLSDAQS